MSSHDDLIKRLHDKSFQYSADPILTEVAQALTHETNAHEKTRQECRAALRRCLSFQGQVCGLEALAARLRDDMYKMADDTRRRAENESECYAAGYTDGRKSVTEAVDELFASMERP